MSREKVSAVLLAHLHNDVWARIAPSETQGVGLVAIREIPEGTVVDRVPAELMPPKLRREIPTRRLPASELAKLPPEVRAYLHEMYVVQDGAMDLGGLGVNSFVGLSHFVNHPPDGREPNSKFVDGTDDDLGFNMKLMTIRKVPAGAELYVDYLEYLSPQELSKLPGMGHLRHERPAAEQSAPAEAAAAQ
eukprot:Hpha_TRINITY_DN27935_c0_g1::TRINITY_DN27935_c0_g1_i1::g.45028::m.45028